MHIPEYSQIVSPLYLVTHKKNHFHWGPEQQHTFAQIKKEITHAVALGPVRTGSDVKNVLYSAAGSHGMNWKWKAAVWSPTGQVTEATEGEDAHVPKSQANEEQQNNKQVDQAAKIEVSKADLDWQHKGDLFLAR
ncbi:hypothetical protein HGM15179_022501 [Zosterops borbonicus]|uniref:Reverse transcriptase/retrotransposon-derived protein RNase H-like domain-containing protein n=1 Tax=Zosterops borbonicus TaxID=364589 RepID=A0A8K1D683_9PASS|nr:hypothetical protein HGM15179_022501 [Zosterops borbonicus]